MTDAEGRGRSWRIGAGVFAFLLWEGWWAYEFLAARPPDEEMRTLAAILFGLVLPLTIGLFVWLRNMTR